MIVEKILNVTIGGFKNIVIGNQKNIIVGNA